MASDEAIPSSSALYGGGERGAGGKFRKPSARRPPLKPYDRPKSRDGGWISKLVGGATRILPSLFSRSPSPVAIVEDPEYINSEEEEENNDEENKNEPSSLGKSESAEEANPRQDIEILNNNSNAFHPKNSLPGGTEFSKIEQLVKEKQFSRDDVNRLVELLHSKVSEASNIEPLENKPKNPFKREYEGSVLAQETPKLIFKEKQEPLLVAGLRTPTPLFHSKVEEVGASPIDIAKAYMANQGSDISTDDKAKISKYSAMSACRPGAMSADRFGHSTPQSLSSRYGLHQFQRTPYSRSIYSKSKSKLADPEAGRRFQNFPSSSRLQPQTPIFGQSERIHDNISGSVGPMRRLRHKFLSEATPKLNSDSAASKATTELFSEKANFTLNKAESSLPAFQTSNPAVRAILEHLDRHVPTPKEKLAELQFATSSNKSLFPILSDSVIKEGNDEAKSSLEERPKELVVAADVDKATNISTNVNGNFEYQKKSSNETFSFEEPIITKKPLKKPPHHQSMTRPNLPSISIEKPQSRQTLFSNNNNSSFTFPVSSSFSTLPEPPTPSIMPPQQKNDGNEILNFRFGEKSLLAPRLKFSFPSTSNVSTKVEVLDIKFSFGVGNKSRLSFKSAVGEDGICY